MTKAIQGFPTHNRFLRVLYYILAIFMITFFLWLLLDPKALYYVSYHQQPVVDYASCVNAGGEIHGSDCYLSETLKFSKGSE
jgi:hypothetical protein